ncbi:LOW QUALITY PROTEIN: hypothetical protein CVT25_011160, partial [Psilocybe cyanescens]
LFLPQIHGRFPVGVTTFATPVRPARPIGTIKLKSNQSQESALYLEEVAFTAYYPADVKATTSKKGVPWFLRPLRESLHGFAAFLGNDVTDIFTDTMADICLRCSKMAVVACSVLLWSTLEGKLKARQSLRATWGLTIPAYPNAPLLSPLRTKELSQWPLVIFSHGLGGGRTAYRSVLPPAGLSLLSSTEMVLALSVCLALGMQTESRNPGRYFTLEKRTYSEDYFIIIMNSNADAVVVGTITMQ